MLPEAARLFLSKIFLLRLPISFRFVPKQRSVLPLGYKMSFFPKKGWKRDEEEKKKEKKERDDVLSEKGGQGKHKKKGREVRRTACLVTAV